MRTDSLDKYPYEKMKAKTKGNQSHKEREIARLYALLNSLPPSLIRLLTVQQLMIAFDFDLHGNYVSELRRDYLNNLEGNMTGKHHRQGKAENADKMNQPKEAREVEKVEAQLVLEQSAGILTKTYAYAGDAGEKIAPEDALRLLVREFRKYDQSLLTRNEKRAVR
jgi:hypothetical protein